MFVKAVNFSKLTPSEKYELAIKLGTAKGFYMFYFDSLYKFKSQISCFNNANDIYFSIYKEYKYKDYDSFRVTVSRTNNSKN